MIWQNVWRIVSSDYTKLVLILALAFYIAFIPHLGYPYPVHIDEWVHLAKAKALQAAGSTTFVEPFYGEHALSISSNLEAGFHLFWTVFQSISGISWLTIFRYFPSVIFMITVLSVYVMARREGFGWEAALFTCLIPTTVGILGPAFMVPVAMGLMFILPLPLFVVFNFKTIRSYLVLFIFNCFLLVIHAPTAIGLFIILIPYILLNLKEDAKHSLGITLAMFIPFLVPFPWIFNLLLPTFQLLFTPQPIPAYVDFPRVIEKFGYLPVLLCLLGTFVLAIKGGKKNYGLIIGLLALLLMLVSFFTFHYGVEIVYARGLMYVMLVASVVAGVGLMSLKNFRLPAALGARLRLPELLTTNVGRFLCLALVIATLAMVIPDRQKTNYYHMIDTEDYQAFAWIQENVDKSYQKAILDPWKATAFSAITGKRVYTRIHAFPVDIDTQTYDFLKNGSRDTALLRDNGISIVYSRGEVNNPDLVQVRQFVYLLKDAETK